MKFRSIGEFCDLFWITDEVIMLRLVPCKCACMTQFARFTQAFRGVISISIYLHEHHGLTGWAFSVDLKTKRK
jgi:hypothetical protein